MSNIINVKEERNVLSFVGEVFSLVAHSSNFYLKFELDSEWELNKIVTVIFNFDGRCEYVELDENRMCQIPPTSSSKVWFCITAEPDDVSRISSTILSLDVEESGEVDSSHVEAYQYAHASLLGVVQNLLTGNNIKAKTADFAAEAGVSQTQVSLTGDEEIAGEKNFVGEIKHNSNVVLDSSQISNENLIINPDFKVNQRDDLSYTRKGEDIYTADRWGLFKGNGKFSVKTHKLTGQDETQPTVLCQRIEDSWFIYGETITVSATIDGVRYSKTITLPENYEEDYINNIYECDNFAFRIYVSKANEMIGVQFLVVNGVVIVVNRVKLELSPVETKYVERPISEETNICQRYFQKVIVSSLGNALRADKINFFVPLMTSVRAGLKVEFVSGPKLYRNGTATLIDASAINVNYLASNGVMFTITGTDFVQYDPYFLMNGQFKIEGEYYL